MKLLQILFTIASLGLLIDTPVVTANEYRDYFNREGVIDLSLCDALPWDIPTELLLDGYYGEMGYFVPGLPEYELHTQTYSQYLTGNATYARRGFYDREVLYEKTQAWGLDAADYVGAIATDSCGYVQQNAWLRTDETEWIGPFLIADCTAFIHKYERACYLGTVVEVDYGTYEIFKPGGRGLLENIQVRIENQTILDPIPPPTVESPVNFPQTWLQDSRLTCNSG